MQCAIPLKGLFFFTIKIHHALLMLYSSCIMLGTNKIASKKFPSNLSDPSTSKIKERSTEQRTHFGIFGTTHPAEIEPVVATQPSESRVCVTNRPPEMGIFTNRLSEQYAGTPAVYSQIGKQNPAVAQPHRVTKEKIIENQYPAVVNRLHAPDVAGMSAVTRFFESNCNSDIARKLRTHPGFFICRHMRLAVHEVHIHQCFLPWLVMNVTPQKPYIPPVFLSLRDLVITILKFHTLPGTYLCRIM